MIGPGSLYTSVLAACVVPGISQALAGTHATRVYVANLRPEVPETAGARLGDHVNALRVHGIRPDLVIVDSSSPFAHDPCDAPTIVADVAGANGLVHDVQKLARVLDSTRRTKGSA